MIFPDHRAVLRLHALTGHTRPHHLGQSVDVHRIDPCCNLYRAAHGIRPRLGTEYSNLERTRSRVEPHALHLLDDHLHIARCHHDDVRPEVLNQLHLFFRLATRHRHDRAAKQFSAVVRAQPAGKEAVAIGDVHDITGATARRANGARDQLRPCRDVVLCVPDDRRLARRAG